MKKIIIVVALAALVFTSCDMVVDSVATDLAKGHTMIYREEWKDLTTHREIGLWLSAHVEYRYDDIYEWSDPGVTLARGYGDCNDMAILYMNIAYVALGIEMELVLVEDAKIDYSVPQPMKSIESGGFVDHVMVRYDGVLISPYYGTVVEGPVGYYYSFWQVF